MIGWGNQEGLLLDPLLFSFIPLEGAKGGLGGKQGKLPTTQQTHPNESHAGPAISTRGREGVADPAQSCWNLFPPFSSSALTWLISFSSLAAPVLGLSILQKGKRRGGQAVAAALRTEIYMGDEERSGVIIRYEDKQLGLISSGQAATINCMCV